MVIHKTNMLTTIQIVSQASAGFLQKPATIVPNTDHNTVCKFDSRFEGYSTVLDRLQRLREELLGIAIPNNEHAHLNVL